MSQSLSLLKTLANTAITRKTLSFSCFASQNKEDYMAKNSKKIIALTAAAGAVGAVAATLAACFTKYRKNKNADKTADEITADNENDDIDTIDFESLTNDTPREYVSISINTHKEKE
jgi:heme/copper-type cytochrome/quinol oxidase subunit 2